MSTNYTKEQFRKIFNALPEELKETVISGETAEDIFNVCTDEDLKYEQISEVARYAGRVLMGLIPPESFQETLEKELKIKKETAKEIARKINRFIFYPVKELINSINKISNTVEKKEIPGKEVKKEENRNVEKENIITTNPDSYREEIE
ncbi:MAG: hypothetical protein ABID67_00290 [Candidatus Nealsonbacteria bacterium]